MPTNQAEKLPLIREMQDRIQRARSRGFIKDADWTKIEKHLPKGELKPIEIADLPEQVARPFTERDGTRGRIVYNGNDITGSRPAAIARMGLVRSFQISAVFPHLSVLENVRIALQRKGGHSFDFWKSERSLSAFDGRARELIDAVGLAGFEETVAVELAYGRKRALEIATTLALDPEMMLLDEPTAGMTHEDVDRIAALIKRVSANRTVLMVEHNLSVVSNLSDHITVLARGEVLAQGNYETVSTNPAVVEAYMGGGYG